MLSWMLILKYLQLCKTPDDNIRLKNSKVYQNKYSEIYSKECIELALERSIYLPLNNSAAQFIVFPR